MNRLIATIEHSGTFALLREFGWQDNGKGVQVVPLLERARAKPGDLLHAHLYDVNMEAILEHAKTQPVVTAIRPLDELKASWVERGRNMAKLDMQLANYEKLLVHEPRIVQLERETVTKVLQSGRLWQ